MPTVGCVYRLIRKSSAKCCHNIERSLSDVTVPKAGNNCPAFLSTSCSRSTQHWAARAMALRCSSRPDRFCRRPIGYDKGQEHTHFQPPPQVPQGPRPQAARGCSHPWIRRRQLPVLLGARSLPAERNEPVPIGPAGPDIGLPAGPQRKACGVIQLRKRQVLFPEPRGSLYELRPYYVV